jgi:hypothetical protein
MNRTWAIVLTIASVLLCGCPGLFLCAFGAAGIAGLPVTTTLNDTSNTAPMGTPMALALLCGAIILILIPVLVGFFTLRKKAAPAVVVSEPMPPAS